MSPGDSTIVCGKIVGHFFVNFSHPFAFNYSRLVEMIKARRKTFANKIIAKQQQGR